MTDTCNICVEKLNKSNRCPVTCSACDFTHCKQCFQKYLLETTQPLCMNCKKVFNQDFLFNNCTSTFLNNELKKHRETVLLNEQKSYLPETQPLVVARKQILELQKEINELEIEKRKLCATIDVKINNCLII